MTKVKIVYSLDGEGITLSVHPSQRELSKLPRIFVAFDVPRPDRDHLLEFMRPRWPAIITILTGLTLEYEAEIVDAVDESLLARVVFPVDQGAP